MTRSYLACLAFPLAACGSSVSSEPLAPDSGVAVDAGGDAPLDVVADTALPDTKKAALGELQTARSLLGTALAADGRVYAFAGLTEYGIANTSERYDATTNTWTGAAPAKARRYGHATASSLAAGVYLVGGTSDGKSPLATVEHYAPSTDTWTAVTSLPSPRLALGAAVGADGLLYAIGGRGSDGVATDLVEVYSPTTLAWTKLAKLPTPRQSLAVVVGADKKVYALGGRDVDDAPLDVVEVFDPAKGTWETGQPMRSRRYWFGATLGPDGRIYAGGGVGLDATSKSIDFLASFEAWAPGAPGGWTALTPLPVPRGWLSCVATSDGRVLAVGGSLPAGTATQPPPVATMVAYNPKANAWSDTVP